LSLGGTKKKNIEPHEPHELVVPNFSGIPKFRVCEMEKAKANGDAAGFIVCNPPYGKRLGDETEAEKNYRAMGGLVERFPGWKIVVISDSAGFESQFGHKADTCTELTNGALKTYLYVFNGISRD
jgi:putative N6-adenine-specific DNA methylase